MWMYRFSLLFIHLFKKLFIELLLNVDAGSKTGDTTVNCTDMRPVLKFLTVQWRTETSEQATTKQN